MSGRREGDAGLQQNADLQLPAAEGYDWNLKVATLPEVQFVVAQLASHMPHGQRQALRDKLSKYVCKPERDLILAYRDSSILGFNCVIERDSTPIELAADEASRLYDFACCNGLLVHPRYRRRGIGYSLQVAAESWARERGRKGIWLITHHRADWYRKHFGYREIGRTFVKGVIKRVLIKVF